MGNIVLPDGSLFPINPGETPDQTQAAAKQMYPAAFGITPQHGLIGAFGSAFKGAVASGIQGLGALTGSSTLEGYGQRAAAKVAQDTNAYTPTSDADVSAAFDKGLGSGIYALANQQVAEPLGGMAGRFLPVVGVGAAAPYLIPEEGAAVLGGTLTRALVGKAAQTAVDTPIEEGENVQRIQQAAASGQQVAPTSAFNTALASLSQAFLLTAAPEMGKAGLNAYRAMGPALADTAEQVARGEITQGAALATLRGTATNILQHGVENAAVGSTLMVGDEALRTAQSGEDPFSPAALSRYGEGLKSGAELALLGGPMGAYGERAAEIKPIAAAAAQNAQYEDMAANGLGGGTRADYDARASAFDANTPARNAAWQSAVKVGQDTTGDLFPAAGTPAPVPRTQDMIGAQRVQAYYTAMANATADPTLRTQYTVQANAQAAAIADMQAQAAAPAAPAAQYSFPARDTAAAPASTPSTVPLVAPLSTPLQALDEMTPAVDTAPAAPVSPPAPVTRTDLILAGITPKELNTPEWNQHIGNAPTPALQDAITNRLSQLQNTVQDMQYALDNHSDELTPKEVTKLTSVRQVQQAKLAQMQQYATHAGFDTGAAPDQRTIQDAIGERQLAAMQASRAAAATGSTQDMFSGEFTPTPAPVEPDAEAPVSMGVTIPDMEAKYAAFEKARRAYVDNPTAENLASLRDIIAYARKGTLFEGEEDGLGNKGTSPAAPSAATGSTQDMFSGEFTPTPAPVEPDSEAPVSMGVTTPDLEAKYEAFEKARQAYADNPTAKNLASLRDIIAYARKGTLFEGGEEEPLFEGEEPPPYIATGGTQDMFSGEITPTPAPVEPDAEAPVSMGVATPDLEAKYAAFEKAQQAYADNPTAKNLASLRAIIADARKGTLFEGEEDGLGNNRTNPGGSGGGDAMRGPQPDSGESAPTVPRTMGDNSDVAGYGVEGAREQPDTLAPVEATPLDGDAEANVDPDLVQQAATQWNQPLAEGDVVNKLPYSELNDSARSKLYALAEKNTRTPKGALKKNPTAITRVQQRAVMKAHLDAETEPVPVGQQAPAEVAAKLNAAVEQSRGASAELRANHTGEQITLENADGEPSNAPANSVTTKARKRMEQVAKVIECLGKTK